MVIVIITVCLKDPPDLLKSLVSSHYSLHTEDATVWDEGLMSILEGISPNGVVWRSSKAQGTGGLPFARH